jgi:hypothetical protein
MVRAPNGSVSRARGWLIGYAAPPAQARSVAVDALVAVLCAV